VRRVGAHLSISGGLYKAVESVVSKGGNCLQIFSSSPRMWMSKLPSKEEVERFNQLAKENDVKPVIIHAKYLVNLASDNLELVEKSRKSLEFDFKVGEMIKAAGVVVHLGSHLGRGFEVVKDQLVEEIKKILKASSGSVKFLIENVAQKKGKIGYRLEEIRLLIEAVDSSRLGWCLDTCHAYSAGYSLGKDLGNALLGFDIVDEVKRLKLVESLDCLHINDSRDVFDSGRDRHANLGEGEIGLEALKSFLGESVFNHLPLIIETPGFDNKGPDKRNLDILKSLI
jgi:deoxyribonuclease IV